MRRSPAFNAADGEWLCRIAEIGKSGARLTVERQLRPARARTRSVAAVRADQAGPARLARREGDRTRRLGAVAGMDGAHPVRARQSRTVAGACRSRRPSRASVCRCPRLRPPERARPAARRLAGRAAAHRVRRERRRRADRPTPRRGFRDGAGGASRRSGRRASTETELDALGKLSFVTRVGLGPRVLRAETAAACGLGGFPGDRR